MKAAFPSLALSTIYRNLERFAADALVERSDFGDGVVRYSLAREQHGHYLVCTGCHAKIKLCDCPPLRQWSGPSRRRPASPWKATH